MELTSEDQLRLSVMAAQSLQAVRIDEAKMIVHALSDKGEAKVQLHPTVKDEKYLRLVRQFLSTHYFGSPGGYPIYIRRWTRMGQARDTSLEKLLLLGEPEAVTAVVHAPGLTSEIARRAWWVKQEPEHARRMLEKTDVIRSAMGPVLAQFLIEFLPFEEEPKDMIDSVRLVLQPGLIDHETRLDIWARAKRKNTYYVGFLQQTPHDLPHAIAAHPLWVEAKQQLKDAIQQENQLAYKLVQVLSDKGQAFLATAEAVLDKPANQDVMIQLLNAIGDYFLPMDVIRNWRDVNQLSKHAIDCMNEDESLRKIECKPVIAQVLRSAPELKQHVFAVLFLAMLKETLLDPIFGVTDAVGSVMRKKIQPLVSAILAQIHILLNKS